MLIRVIVPRTKATKRKGEGILNTCVSPFQKLQVQGIIEVVDVERDKNAAPTAVRLAGKLLVHHRSIRVFLARTVSCALALIGLSIRFDISSSTAEHFSTPTFFEDNAERPETICPLQDSPARFI
jgi:hypothetical protein